MSNAEIFRRAADYIREHGHAKGTLGLSGGPACALGVLVEVTAGLENVDRYNSLRSAPWDTPHNILQSRLGYSVVDWNNASERTADEVIAVFDSLADDEELKDQIAMQASEFNDGRAFSAPLLLKKQSRLGEGVKGGKISRR